MSQPKKKTSKSRSRTRRTHYRAAVPGLSTCSRCKSFTKPHQVCSVCGYYKGKEILSLAE